MSGKGKDTGILLKNGLIVDGTGAPAEKGSVLIKGGRIEKISRGAIAFRGPEINCAGKVIAPGFVDMHSHNDWFLPTKGKAEFKTPFTGQGITTFVGGNCGFSIAGLADDARPENLELITDNLFKAGHDGISWRSMADFAAHAKRTGLTHNLAMLAGHGTARTSLRGFNAAPLGPDEMKRMIFLLEKSMDEGARGVSLGLQYEPGIFSTVDELREIARAVKRKDGILTAHKRAFTTISTAYPLKPFGEPHNLKALRELLDIARETGVRLQVSHLIFVGEKTWNTCERALALIDRAIDDGVDVKFDTYSYGCGASVINVLLPPWFLAGLPGSYESRAALLRLSLELKAMQKLLGFGVGDIQVTFANDDELNAYNGMFLSDIARKRGLPDVRNLLDFARRSGGRARVLMHRYSTPEIVRELMRHRASMFMTDAWVEPSGAQNPAAFGCFPRFLQIARESGCIGLEEAVRKMTLAGAERFGLERRGAIREKFAADIVVFDPEGIRDNNTVERTDLAPGGIEAVFINGVRVLKKGKADSKARPGMML
jgi:N-acyl-D-amino-acid deacylase